MPECKFEVPLTGIIVPDTPNVNIPAMTLGTINDLNNIDTEIDNIDVEVPDISNVVSVLAPPPHSITHSQISNTELAVTITPHINITALTVPSFYTLTVTPQETTALQPSTHTIPANATQSSDAVTPTVITNRQLTANSSAYAEFTPPIALADLPALFLVHIRDSGAFPESETILIQTDLLTNNNLTSITAGSTTIIFWVTGNPTTLQYHVTASNYPVIVSFSSINITIGGEWSAQPQTITVPINSAEAISYRLCATTTTTRTLQSRELCVTATLDVPATGFDNLNNVGNTFPEGIWSDGRTMWVLGLDDTKIYAYNFATKARDSSKDFDTLRAADNISARGIWSDGTTMWVVDWGDTKIYAYNLATKARDSSKDFNTLRAADNFGPQGIWSDGTTMWVSDDTSEKIYAYNLATKARDSSKDFNTLAAADNTNPQAIWSDGTTMWIADRFDEKIYAYNLATKARDSSKDFNTLAAAGNTHPAGLWSDGTTMWVSDDNAHKIYAYNLATKQTLQTIPVTGYGPQDFITLLAAGNTNPQGIWSDGTTMWVLDRFDRKLYAYNLATKARDSSKDFNTLRAARNFGPEGIWSDGTTMWVSDNFDNKLYAYNLATKARDSSKDFSTLPSLHPDCLWSDGTTMWISDSGERKLYAYNLATKARDSSKDFDTLAAAGNTHPQGLWSDGTTMWIADRFDRKLYAYNLATKARDSSKDFDTLAAAGNTFAYGIWSDGTTMWVVDDTDDKIYAYNLATKAYIAPTS